MQSPDQAAVPLILAPELSASAKLLWFVLRLHAPGSTLRPAQLETHCDLSRKTVLKGLAELAAHGWYLAGAIDREPHAAAVSIPDALLTNCRLSRHGRLLYGQLQMLPSFERPRGHFTYAQLHSLLRARPETLRRAVAELVHTRWLEIAQEHRRAPIHFLLCDPVVDKDVAEMLAAEQRLDGVKYLGEALMREYLSLLVYSRHFQDNATPDFLVNPFSDQHLQLDRYYSPPEVAFEFNGPQHYGATEQFPEEASARQQRRDLIKAALCSRAGVTLVVVHPQDLSVAGMRKKIHELLPLRDLKGHEQLVTFLESEGDRCRRIANRHGWRTP